MPAPGSLLAVALFLSISVPAAAGAQAVGPRPLRLVDLTPASMFSLTTEFGQMGDQSGLAFPIEINYQLRPEVAFTAELPFGYANRRSQPAQPVVGNLALGVRGSKYTALGELSAMRYGLALTGRLPTGPRLGPPDEPSERSSLLRSISVYESERWTPAAGAIRLDLSIAFDFDVFAVAFEVGGAGVLPVDARPATLAYHYGLLFAAKAISGMWLMLEAAGATAAPGRPEDVNDDHIFTLAAGVRLDLGRVSPAFFVSVPVVGTLGGRRPIVLSLELATF